MENIAVFVCSLYLTISSLAGLERDPSMPLIADPSESEFPQITGKSQQTLFFFSFSHSMY